MVLGKVVVVSDLPPLKNIIVDKYNGLTFAKGNVLDLYSKINSLFSYNNTSINEIKENAIETCKRYDNYRIVEEIKESYDLVKVDFIINNGNDSWDSLSGNPSNKTETWKNLFGSHLSRVSKPTKPQARWDERILKCDTIEGWHTLSEEYSNSANLQSPENEQLLNDSKESIGITEG